MKWTDPAALLRAKREVGAHVCVHPPRHPWHSLGELVPGSRGPVLFFWTADAPTLPLSVKRSRPAVETRASELFGLNSQPVCSMNPLLMEAQSLST